MDMFEDVLRGVEAELGPLNIHWFEELTVKASRHGHQPVAEVQQTSSVSRAPADTPTLDSQVSSTPKMLRCRTSESPFSFLGDFSAPGMQTPLQGLLRTDSNPCLFGSAKDSQRTEKEYGSRKTNECFGLLDTPISSLVQDSEAKRISESLGAQMNPDISWSSSFNTPSTLTPTVILSRQETQSSPVSFLRDKEVIIVRNLFPSLSKDTHPASERQTSVQHIDLKGRADAKASNTSLDDLDGLWKQTVPDAIKDADVRGTVKSVLDGAEDVLSIFFSKSSSALRRVKTKARIKKRTTLAAESFAHLTLASNVDLRSVETCTAVKIESPPISKDLTQWTPLSLSDVPDSKTKQIIASELANKQHNNLLLNSDSAQHTCRDSNAQVVQSSCAVEKLQCFPDSYSERAQARGSFMEASPSLTLARKPRRFVYRVQSPCPSTEVGKGTATPVWSSDTDTGYLTVNQCLETSLFEESKHGEDARTKDTGDHMLQAGETTGKQMTWSTLSVDQGLNMTQLCEAFAEDFTQGVNLDKSPNQRAHSKHDSLASQKADVTELCSILEEACSQYEFTQVRPTKLGLKPLDSTHVEKDWDSDILADIDFDDSFNCAVESRLSQKYQTKIDSPTHQTPVLNSMHSKDESIQAVSISQPCCKTLKVEPNTSDENESYCSGFKTASGKTLSVSDKCLSKAKSLFADLEDSEENIVTLQTNRPDTVEQKLKQSPKCHTTEPSPEACNDGLYCTKKLNKLELKAEESLCNENSDSVMTETEICKHIDGSANLEAMQRSVDQKLNLLEMNAVNFGFKTAGGKEVKVSEKALVNAKRLLNEVENFEARNMCEATVSLKAPPKTKAVSCILTPVHDRSNISTESLRKVGEERFHDSTEKKCQPSQSIQSDGFKLASGKGVSVSASAIQMSKAIFRDIENSVNCSNGIKLEDGNTKLDSEANRNQNKSVKVYKMASSRGVSISEKAFKEAKTFFKDYDLDCSDISQEKGDKSSVMDDCGFKAVVVSMVHLPEMDRLNKEALSLKQQSTALNKHVREEFAKTSAETLQSTSGCSFSTANGKTVSVSAEALQRAKAVLADSADTSPCEKRMEISEEKNVPEKRSTIPGRSWNFSTASGKKVAVSDKALRKAKSLFSECEVEGSLLDEGLSKTAETSATEPECARCLGFSTASGKGVAVSEKALMEVKTPFDNCADLSVDVHDIESHLNMPKVQQKSFHGTSVRKCIPANAGKPEGKFEIVEDGDSEADALKSGNVGFSMASGKGVTVSKSALEAALPTFKECDAEPAAGVHGESPLISECQASGVNENNQYKMGQIIATVPSFASLPAHGDSSLLNCRSLNTGGCNETQQKYLEQEAMACTKALLEDDLDEHSLLEDTGFRESRPEHKLSIEANIARKRMSDGRGLTGQPPLKRRLVSEFNQISDGSRVCTPATSSPNGTLNDRRVFTCNLHLKPNITLPSRDVTERKAANPDFHVAFPHSADQKRAAANLKATVFVPPFQKNSRPEAPKPCVSTDIAKGPSVFVPPFKKEDSLGGIDLLRSPSHNSSVSKSSSILSSGQENKMTFVKGKAHIVGTQEDWKKETEAQRDVKLGSLPTGTSEDKVFEVWQQSLELARDIQDMRIRKKKRQTVRPLPGSLYLAKTSGVTRISLREAVGHKNPVQHTQEELYQRGVHRKVSQISSENAESFRFGWAEFFGHEALAETGGVQLADGGWLIPNNEASAGKEEFYRALCDTPGVDPKLISEAWVYNHYRWIVWKQASMERTFPEVYGGLCLTPEQVLLQLKLRYDIEVDHSRRSALKKIMEMDDTPAKTLVLCVCGIATSVRNQVGTEKAAAPTDPRLEAPAAVVWLTDGWYSIKSLLDLPLSSMLQKGRLRVGGKIIVHGAELIGSQDACAPLEAPDSLMLKISANSTRPARWDAKMGFHKDPRPFQVSLSSLYSTGGVVGCVDIIVLRSYPTQWMEKLSGGIFVFRNERAEDREARRHSSAKQKNLELLFFKIQAQFEKEEEKKKKTRNHRRTFTRQEIERLQDGEELYEAVESDPGYMETHLSVQQVEAVNSYRRGVAEQRQAELQERVRRAVQEAHKAEGGCLNRDVTPVWKLAIADSNDQHGNHVYTLNIWRPSAELSSLLREGGRYKAYHLATSETKKHSASAHVQFTATKKTQFQELEVCPEQLSKCFPLRRVASFRELQDPRFSSPCGEVDLVGYVISVLDRQGSSPLVYLVDDGLDFVSVRTSGSLVQLAVEDLVRPMALLAVSNLRPQQLCAPVPDLYAGEQSLFSTHPKDPHIKGAMARINSFVQGYKSFFSVAEEKLSNLIPPGCSNSFPSLRTPGFLPKQNIRIATPQQAGRVFSPFTPVSKPSPSPAGGSEPKDPRSVKRKRGIDYLSRIPSPPPITPLGTGTSPSVNRTFNPPRRSETPQCPRSGLDPSPSSAALPVEEQWVKDEELALINTQALDGMGQAHGEGPSST
ncbi:breast cancer type 2 susceptibility protein isoform X3 [Electrophorus electricus]|uniref:breast cancer type 2 susceptibility protein isoform X3 n=1 Tax=Electrophorus electricus TaxID=8005 RepID=UPI0015D0A733|nr:breast cancer type 2 susceptibility protein isoform X3 [Electrophorus electricus]